MRSKAPLLLMEQMVMLLVFALAAALCVQAFVKSDMVSARGEARDQAVLIAQTAAETIRMAGGSAEEALTAAAEELPEAEYADGTLRVLYDEEWQALPADWSLAPPADQVWQTRAMEARALPDEEGLSHASVTVSEEGKELFSIEVAWQTPIETNP